MGGAGPRYTDVKMAYLPGCMTIATRAFDKLSLPTSRRCAGAAALAARFEDVGREFDHQLLDQIFPRNGLVRVVPSPEFSRPRRGVAGGARQDRSQAPEPRAAAARGPPGRREALRAITAAANGRLPARRPSARALSRFARLRASLMEMKSLFRCAGVSLAAVVVEFALLTVLVSAFHLYYLAGAIIAGAVGLLIAFKLNRSWAFSDGRGRAWRQLAEHTLVVVGGIGLGCCSGLA